MLIKDKEIKKQKKHKLHHSQSNTAIDCSSITLCNSIQNDTRCSITRTYPHLCTISIASEREHAQYIHSTSIRLHSGRLSHQFYFTWASNKFYFIKPSRAIRLKSVKLKSIKKKKNQRLNWNNNIDIVYAIRCL